MTLDFAREKHHSKPLKLMVFGVVVTKACLKLSTPPHQNCNSSSAKKVHPEQHFLHIERNICFFFGGQVNSCVCCVCLASILANKYLGNHHLLPATNEVSWATKKTLHQNPLHQLGQWPCPCVHGLRNKSHKEYRYFYYEHCVSQTTQFCRTNSRSAQLASCRPFHSTNLISLRSKDSPNWFNSVSE